MGQEGLYDWTPRTVPFVEKVFTRYLHNDHRNRTHMDICSDNVATCPAHKSFPPPITGPNQIRVVGGEDSDWNVSLG